MRELQKKIVAVVTALTISVWVAGPALGATVEELQAQINALLSQLQTLQQQLTAQGGGTVAGTRPAACAGITFSRSLSQTMTGSDVKCLQAILNLNADTKVAASGAGSPGNETSYFGSLTKAAVINFQEKYATEILAPIGLTSGTGFVGAKTIAKLNALMAGTGTTPPPITGSMTVALAPTTPSSANVWRGTANNAVLRVTLAGGPTAVNITGLTLTNYGTTEATGVVDLSAIKVFDENNIQVGTDRTMAGNKVFFVFVPAVTIPVNGSRTLTVDVNVGTLAAVVSQIQLGIAGPNDITGGAFAGTFPIKGNAFTIVPAGSVGSVSVGDYGTVPKTSVKIGEKDVVLERFTVSAGANEDISLNQITITNSAAATISDNDIANIRIREVGGSVIAGPTTLLNKKATFNLTSAVLLTKGTAKSYEVIADIVSGENRTIEINLAAGAIVGQGSLSSANVVSVGPTTAETITIGAGTLVITMSNNHPQGSAALLIKTVNRKTLAVFSVRAIGEDVILNTVDLNLNATNNLGSTNYLSSVGLYVGDVLVSNLQNVAVETDVTFTLNWTIPANTTQDITVKGLTNTLGSDASYSLITTWSAYTGYGLSSGKALSSAADTGTSAITIYGTGTATLAQDVTKTPYSQGVLAPTNNIVLGALKVYAQREDQRLKALVVTPQATGKVTTLTIYSDDGLTALTNPVSEASGVFSFAVTDILSDIIFSKGVYKTIVLKGNIPAASDGTTGFYLTIASSTSQFKTTGLDSGSDFDAGVPVGSLPFNFKFTSPFDGGTYSFDKTIVEMKKNASSPSGTVDRGSYVTYAGWDVNNMSSDLAAAVITSIKFTSKTGLPASGPSAANFRLYDELGAAVGVNGVGGVTTTVTLAAGTVQFDGLSISVNYGSPKILYLRIDTTNTTNWPSNQQMQWSVLDVDDCTITGPGYLGFGGTTYSIPADTNIVKLP